MSAAKSYIYKEREILEEISKDLEVKKNKLVFESFCSIMADDNQAARIFVGNLPETADQVTIRERFKGHGLIKMITILRGFCFVQFAKEEAARAAIAAEHNTEFLGQVIHVKEAKRSAKKEKENERKILYERPPRSEQASDSREDRYHLSLHGEGNVRGRIPPRGRRPNDCEVICTDRLNRRYCEALERRLRHFGMAVDVIFPNPDVDLSKILFDVGDRGVRYACVVTPVHQESVTFDVHILKGSNAERHMSVLVDEGVSLLAADFEKFVEAEAKATGAGGPAANSDDVTASLPPIGRHPPDVAAVISFLRDNRPLSVMEYDKIIKYLAARREQMLRNEYGDNVPAHLANVPIGPPVDAAAKAREEQLTKRILRLWEKPHFTSSSTAPSSVISSGPTRSLDPNALAIDSLIKTGPNLLASAYQEQPPRDPFSAFSFGDRL